MRSEMVQDQSLKSESRVQKSEIRESKGFRFLTEDEPLSRNEFINPLRELTCELKLKFKVKLKPLQIGREVWKSESPNPKMHSALSRNEVVIWLRELTCELKLKVKVKLKPLQIGQKSESPNPKMHSALSRNEFIIPLRELTWELKLKFKVKLKPSQIGRKSESPKV